MDRLPIVVSVPHAGLAVPPEVANDTILSPAQIIEDSDEGAADIYAFRESVVEFITTPIARAFVDVNRRRNDRSDDGVIKRRTCWDVPIYKRLLSRDTCNRLLCTYYDTYHAKLSDASRLPVWAGIDCHTMAAVGPPIGPMADQQRPWVCVGDGHGRCPSPIFDAIATSLDSAFGFSVSRNVPFHGGFITQNHNAKMPWVQLELSRAPFMSIAEKQARVLTALTQWASKLRHIR